MIRVPLFWGCILVLFGGTQAYGQVASHRDTLQINVGDAIVCMSGRNVFPSTLELFLGEERLSTADYQLDPRTGCLTLYVELSRVLEQRLVAEYLSYDTDLRSSYSRLSNPWLTQTPQRSLGESTPTSPASFSSRDSDGLQVTGSQTLGITLGNRRDAKVNQSLDVRIRGKVGANAEVVAMLSDKDIPFQPEGNTAELDELDKVFLEFKTPRARAGLGDLEMSHGGPRFLKFDRRAEGVQGEAQFLGATSQAAFGSLKGEFKRTEFFGQDGLQGPYRLEGSSGNAVVVAGSESIWLDGDLLERGQDRDYVIDYNRGEITFTSDHPVTVHTRITVDYEVAEGSYKRGILFAGSTDISLGTLGALDVSYFSEKDDVDRALGGDLSQQEMAQLAEIGDDAQTVGSGVRFVGPGQGGEYRQVVDTVENKVIFVFVDSGGDYVVNFAFVGEAKGDYIIDVMLSSEDRDVFTHAGDGQGDHIVKRDLPAPGSFEAVDVLWRSRGRHGSISAEGALSSLDRNTLSALDDSDNHGGALWFEGVLDSLKLGRNLELRPRVQHRSVDQEFQSVSPYQESFQGWYWNLRETPSSGEEVTQVQNRTRYKNQVTLLNEVGRLALGDTLTAWRQDHSLSWTQERAQFNTRWLRVDNRQEGQSVGNLERGEAKLRWTEWRVQPWVNFLSEERQTPGLAQASRSEAYQIGLFTPFWNQSLSLETRLGNRRDDQRTDPEEPWQRDRKERSLGLELKGVTRQLTAKGVYEHRRVTRTQVETQHLGRLDLAHRASQGAWNAQTVWDIGAEAIARSGKSIVPDSTGFFDEFGNYVGPGGGYDVRYVQNEDVSDQTSTLRMTTRLRWAPRKSQEGWDVFRNVSWEGFVNLREASTERALGKLLLPSQYLSSDHVLDGNLRSRQTLNILPHNKRVGFTVRHDLNKRIYKHRAIENEDGLTEMSRTGDLAVSMRHQAPSNWTFEVEALRGTREEVIRSETSPGFERKTKQHKGTLTSGKRFNTSNKSGRLSLAVSFSKERGEDRLAEGWALEPRLQLTLSKKGRIDIRGGWKHLTHHRGFTGLFGPGAPTLTPGWDMTLRGDIKLWKAVNLASTFHYDNPKDVRPIAEGRFEVRGAF